MAQPANYNVLCKSRVVRECKYLPETDSEQVPWEKDEKNFEKRDKKYVKPFEGKRMDSTMRPLSFSEMFVAVRGLRI